MTIRRILLCIAACTIAPGVPATKNTATNGDNVCSSKKCLNVASSLLKIIDPKIDPCENFYEFVCGRFRKSKPANINHVYNQIVEDEIYADIKKLIEVDIEPSEPEAFKLVKRLYKSCMNTAAINTKGLKPLRKYLRRLGGWPVIVGDSWNGKNFDWRRTIYKVHRDGHDNVYYIGNDFGYLIRFVVERNETHPSKRIMALRRPLGLLPRSAKEEDFDRKKSSLRTYYHSMVHLAQMLGADISRTRSEIRKMISFEIKLARIRSPVSKNSKPKEYNPMTIGQLNEEYPSVPWMTYIRNFGASGINITNEKIINVPDPNYYAKLEALMATTPKRIQANYIMSRIALKNAIFLTEEMRKATSRILAARSRFPPRQNRSSYCAAEVTAHLWQGVTIMYANKFVDKETKDAANAIVTNLKRQLEKKLKAYNWPNEDERKASLDKAARLIIHIGYPDSFLNHSKLEDIYRNLVFNENDYFGNMKSLSNYNHELDIKDLKQPLPELNIWGNLRAPTKVNSHYYALENIIHIAAGYLRGLFFGKGRPEYMNYGALGSALGHEMIHAFFEDGIYRDSNERVARYLGLGKRPEFSKRARCLIDQYESYHVNDKGTKLDGRKTLSENMADTGGMRLAYDTYVRWAAKRPEEPRLRGLEQYSAKQMFWISGASIRCEKIKPECISQEIRTKEHTIDEFRVIGMISNIPEFAKDFNCKSDSLMNPAKRCGVWQS